jgi:hypothetical protein
LGTQSSDDPDPAGVGVGEQPVEVVERPEERVDVAVVGHVVAEVAIGEGRTARARARRRRARTGGRGASDALEVADAVAVAS